MSATTGLSQAGAGADHEYWGRAVESAVGVHLANAAAGGGDAIPVEEFLARPAPHWVDA